MWNLSGDSLVTRHFDGSPQRLHSGKGGWQQTIFWHTLYNAIMKLLAICFLLLAACFALPLQGVSPQAGTYAGRINTTRYQAVKVSVTLVPAKNGHFTVQGTVTLPDGAVLNLSGTLDRKGALKAVAYMGTNKNEARKADGSWQPGKGLRVEIPKYGIFGTLPPQGKASAAKPAPIADLSGTWTHDSVGVGGTSTFVFTHKGGGRYTFTESGLGNVKGTASLIGRTLTMEWTEGEYSGSHRYTLDEKFAVGRGTLTWTRKRAGETRGPVFKSTITRR